jgi:hypothetical protein
VAERLQCEGVLAIVSDDGSAPSHWACVDEQGVALPLLAVAAPAHYAPAENTDELMGFFGAGWAIVVAFFFIAYPIKKITQLIARS